MKKIIVGNMKMNVLTKIERNNYFSLFKVELKKRRISDVKIILCPPTIHLEIFAKNIKNKSVFFGAQNIFYEKNGSYTGETSPFMVKSAGADYAIVGHSERRKYFCETNATINSKVKLAFKANVLPIICIGETEKERSGGQMKIVLTKQILESIDGIPAVFLEKILFAYEPIWSVGTDIIPTSNEILEARILIKKIIAEKFGTKRADNLVILYGGSVNVKTVSQVCIESEMDGVLVGRESLNPCEFIKIAQIIDYKK